MSNRAKKLVEDAYYTKVYLRRENFEVTCPLLTKLRESYKDFKDILRAKDLPPQEILEVVWRDFRIAVNTGMDNVFYVISPEVKYTGNDLLGTDKSEDMQFDQLARHYWGRQRIDIYMSLYKSPEALFDTIGVFMADTAVIPQTEAEWRSRLRKAFQRLEDNLVIHTKAFEEAKARMEHMEVIIQKHRDVAYDMGLFALKWKPDDA